MKKNKKKPDFKASKMVLDYVKCATTKTNMTFDEFFDKHNIPKEARNDFATAALLNQAQEYVKLKDIEKKANDDMIAWYGLSGAGKTDVLYLLDLIREYKNKEVK